MAVPTPFLTASTFANTVVLVFGTIGTAFSNVVLYSRDLWRRAFRRDEPLLSRIDFEKLVPISVKRFIAQATAPVDAAEPAFVGAGLAFRRWR